MGFTQPSSVQAHLIPRIKVSKIRRSKLWWGPNNAAYSNTDTLFARIEYRPTLNLWFVHTNDFTQNNIECQSLQMAQQTILGMWELEA